MSGVTVNWAVTSGGGSVSPAQNTSGSNGVASATFTLGPTVGTQTATATSTPTLTGSPLTFTATATTAPATASVTVGDIFFQSVRNSTRNPAVDTVAVNGTVTWTWVGAVGHGVNWLTGSPLPTNSTTKASGTYPWTFTAPGTYTYDCTVHGSLMTGRIVVQ